MMYGRRPRQLLIVWGVALALLALFYRFELGSPAFHEIILPFYWIVVFGALFFTWRWLRARSRKDRRGRDRRRTERRDERAESTGPQN